MNENPDGEEISSQSDLEDMSKSGETQKKPAWQGKSVPNSVKKKRLNYRLRRLIAPKAPIMILNEMIGTVDFTIEESLMPEFNAPMFTAKCEYEGTECSASGPSKQIAKNLCAEQVIQLIASTKSTDPKNILMADAAGELKVPEDETPWVQLASLALFKLFNDWQAQGFVIPPELFLPNDKKRKKRAESTTDASANASETSGNDSSAVVQPKAKKTKAANKGNTLDGRHPVSALNELRCGLSYSLVESRGNPPNIIFVMGSEIEGKMFTGEGKNKKEAKKNCAVRILKELHGFQISDEEIAKN